MAKITLEFDLETELNEVKEILDGYKWKIAVWELDQALRDTTKYDKSVLNQPKASDLEIEIAEKYRELIRDFLQTKNLSL